jgi:hypothetical protein
MAGTSKSTECPISTAPALTMIPLAVDLEDLANILEGDLVYGGRRIDRRTGEVWPPGRD